MSDLERQPLGDSKVIIESNFNPSSTFEALRREWQQVADMDQMKNRLRQIVTSGGTFSKEEYLAHRKFFKIIRKSGTRLIDGWVFLDKSHKYPEELERLVTGIGDLNDAMPYPKRLKVVSNKLLACIDNYGSGIKKQFEPDTFGGFMTIYNKYLSDIAMLLATSPTTIEDHHRLRRRGRSIKHILIAMASAAQNKELAVIGEWLSPISEEMGHEQDAFRRREILEEVDPHTETAVIQPRHRHILETFLQAQ